MLGTLCLLVREVERVRFPLFFLLLVCHVARQLQLSFVPGAANLPFGLVHLARKLVLLFVEIGDRGVLALIAKEGVELLIDGFLGV